MNAQRMIDWLERNGAVVPAMVADLSSGDARWRPDDGAWSIVEIVSHLVDEEIEDFRQRVQLALEDPSADWPKIDPEGAAVDRRYQDNHLDDMVNRFVSERAVSVDWLRGRPAPDWANECTHPRLGRLRAGDLLVSWVAHDVLHLRQITKRLYQLVQRDAGEFDMGYAGPWS